MNDWSELKRLAEAARPGPWSTECDELYWHEDGYTKHLMETYEGADLCHDGEHPANLKFIAAANPAVVLALIAENERLVAEAQSALAGHMHIFNERDLLKTENGRLNAAVKDVHGKKTLADQAVIEIAAECDQLKAENERLNRERTDWQAECLKRGFEYVRESDDHYVLADVPEMAGLLGALLGVEVRDRENHSYGETVSDLTSEVEAGIEAFHRAYEAEKERDQLKAENERLQASLLGYQMGAKAEAEEADRLREKNKGMLEIFADLRASVRCENIHHRTADRHGIHEPCKALARIDAAMAKEARP